MYSFSPLTILIVQVALETLAIALKLSDWNYCYLMCILRQDDSKKLKSLLLYKHPALSWLRFTVPGFHYMNRCCSANCLPKPPQNRRHGKTLIIWRHTHTYTHTETSTFYWSLYLCLLDFSKEWLAGGSVFLFINAPGKQPDLSFYSLSQNLKIEEATRISLYQVEKGNCWFAVIFWTAVPSNQSELRFYSSVGLGFSQWDRSRAFDGDQGPVTKTEDPGFCARLENSQSLLTLKPLFPQGETITPESAQKQSSAKERPQETFVGNSIISSPNSISLPLGLPCIPLPVDCLQLYTVTRSQHSL